MSTLAQLKQLVEDTELQGKIEIATVQMALATKADSEKAEQWKYCDFVLQEPTNPYWIRQIATAAILSHSLTPESSDADISAAVEAVFPTFAVPFGSV